MSPTDDGRPAADGGRSEVDASELFDRRADDVERTRLERWRRRFDAYLYAPLVVGWEDWRTRVGTTIIVGFVLLGTVAPKFVEKPSTLDGRPFTPPFQSWAHPLGTDVLGRNMGELMVHSTQPFIKMIISGALLSVIIGVAIGTVAGYKGGRVDSALMIVTDVMLTIPGLALVMVLASVFIPRDPYVVGLILGIDNWPGLARTVRSQVLSIRESDYVEASRVMGLRLTTIARKDIVSPLMPYISVNTANSARGIVFESVVLYFLGILPFSSLNWGVILNLAYEHTDLSDLGQIHYLVIPAAAITVVAFGFTLFAQGLDRVFNVRLRARHAKSVGGEETEPPAEEF